MEIQTFFWELGVRQSFKHGTITIAADGTRIPFDISVKGILFYYPKNHIKNTEFAEKFKRAIQDILSNPDLPDSHVLEAISGRGTLYEIIRQEEAKRRIDAIITEINFNRKVVDRIYLTVKKPTTERPYITARCRTSAVELLVTNRCLDEPYRSFYYFAEDYCNWMKSINEELARGMLSHPWFESNKKTIHKILKDYEKKIYVAKENLEGLAQPKD